MAVSFDTIIFDMGGLVDLTGNPTRITVRQGGLYLVVAHGEFAAAAGIYNSRLRKNGATFLASQTVEMNTTDVACPPWPGWRRATMWSLWWGITSPPGHS